MSVLGEAASPMMPGQPQVAQTILDSIADGVFTVDESWRITSFNRAAAQITGVPREEALGERCCEVFRASICEAGCALRQTVHTGEPIVNKAIFIVDTQGQKVPISISTALLRDETGRIVGGVETFRDLSHVEQLRKELAGRYSMGDIIGRSRAMRELYEILPAIAASDSTVVIHGASGTGKELFARAIHELSSRRNRRFVALNCGALPDSLLESELFGCKAGAFTDARRDRPGRFAHAEGGTLFLDEIGDISLSMQVRLLRVLQEREYEPLGSVETVHTDVRVIVATHRDLSKLVEQGSFRQDLYYRINVIRLELPGLSERREDIPLLIDHFIGRFNRLQDKDVVGVSDEVLALLMTHSFPGNARELENIIEHAFVLCNAGLIETHHLPLELRQGREVPAVETRAGITLRSVEALHISIALQRHAGNRKAAAEELGIHPSTLFRKLKDLGIEPPQQDGRSRHR
jgi:PAS domain S-box-containing protein